jgi:hypothetical protein
MRRTLVALSKQKGKEWCREGESNPQGTKYRRILSPLRLPVPPSRQFWEFLRNFRSLLDAADAWQCESGCRGLPWLPWGCRRQASGNVIPLGSDTACF